MNNELIKFLNENFYNVEVVNRKSYNVFNFGKRIKNKYNDNQFQLVYRALKIEWTYLIYSTLAYLKNAIEFSSF